MMDFKTKLRNQPNSAFTQVWLQNITNTSDDWSQEKKPYAMLLCRLVVRYAAPLEQCLAEENIIS